MSCIYRLNKEQPKKLKILFKWQILSYNKVIIRLSNKRSLKWHVIVTVVHLHLLAHRAHVVLVEVATQKATTTLLNKLVRNVVPLQKRVVVRGMMPVAVKYVIQRRTLAPLSPMVKIGKVANFPNLAFWRNIFFSKCPYNVIR